MPEREVSVRVGEHAGSGMRVDQYLSDVLDLASRSQLKLRNLRAMVNGRAVRPSHRVVPGDALAVRLDEPEPTSVRPQPIPLSVLYEDEFVVVIDKPVGMVVHPAKGNYSGTLVQGLMWHLGERGTDIGPAGRPGVVHRLDKDTSGIIVTAKYPEAQRYLADQFKSRTTAKRYLAIVKGRVSADRGAIEGYMARDPRNRKRFAMVREAAGKWSETEFRVLARFSDYSFMSLLPKTGRTHQLRVHLQSIGHSILGDPVYARRDDRFPDAALMLHAYRLEIDLPTAFSRRIFRAALPDRFKRTLVELSRADSRRGSQA